MAATKVTVVVMGHTGNGKSTLANTLIGDNAGTAFKESPNAGEETKDTIGKIGTFGGVTVYAIDTPGCGGGEGKTDQYFEKMATFINANKEVQVLILVLNYQAPRFDEDLKKLFEIISGMYPNKPFLDNLAVVWTRFFSDRTNEAERNSRKKVPLDGIKKLIPTATEAQLNSIPQFFLDSKEARKDGNPGRSEIGHLLAWAATKQPLSKMGAMRVKKGSPIVEKRSRQVPGAKRTVCTGVGGHEFGFFGHRSHYYDERQTITTIYEERERQEYTAGDPTFTDWHQVRSETSEKVIRSWHT